jgi:hypothetical protein
LLRERKWVDKLKYLEDWLTELREDLKTQSREAQCSGAENEWFEITEILAETQILWLGNQIYNG